MSSFKYFREKKKRSENKISDSEKNYVDRIVEAAEPFITNNKDMPVETAIEAAYREILNYELSELEKKMQGCVLYATDILKEKYSSLLNNNIKDGESKDVKDN